jgi:hypothetical protein
MSNRGRNGGRWVDQARSACGRMPAPAPARPGNNAIMRRCITGNLSVVWGNAPMRKRNIQARGTELSEKVMATRGVSDILTLVLVGGPAQAFPPIFFFCGGRPTISKRPKPPKKQTDAEQSEAFFLTRCWSINRKICDRHATYYLIVRGVTVAILLFFCSRRTRAQ